MLFKGMPRVGAAKAMSAMFRKREGVKISSERVEIDDG